MVDINVVYPVTRHRQTRDVVLTFASGNDREILEREGMTALRRYRLLRLLREAELQGASLGYRDLSVLLLTSPATLKRDLKDLRERKVGAIPADPTGEGAGN